MWVDISNYTKKEKKKKKKKKKNVVCFYLQSHRPTFCIWAGRTDTTKYYYVYILSYTKTSLKSHLCWHLLGQQSPHPISKLIFTYGTLNEHRLPSTRRLYHIRSIDRWVASIHDSPPRGGGKTDQDTVSDMRASDDNCETASIIHWCIYSANE